VTARFHPGARLDYLGALRFYRGEAGRDRAAGFHEAVTRTLERLALLPHLGAVCPDVEPALGVRRALLRGWPYSLVYLVDDDELVVLAVAHHRRERLDDELGR